LAWFPLLSLIPIPSLLKQLFFFSWVLVFSETHTGFNDSLPPFLCFIYPQPPLIRFCAAGLAFPTGSAFSFIVAFAYGSFKFSIPLAAASG